MRKMIYGKDPEPEPRHDYSSTQVDITGPVAAKIKKLAAAIPDADLGPDGREADCHITARWGLHFATPTQKMRDAIREFGPVKVTLGKTSLFQNSDADVLKVEVKSPDLHRLNALLGRLSPNHTTHPTYIPHATLAYLKPGRGKKYIGDALLDGQQLTFTSLTFSGKNGHRESLPLTGAKVKYRVR